MSLNYRLVRRPDMRKDAAEGSKLYYAQVRSLKKLKFEKFCNMVAVRSSAFVGDVKLVFRMVAGSKGVENEADFNTSFFNKARIVFSPGTMLTQVKKNVTFEHLDLVPAGDKPSSGGGEEKPGEL